MMIQRIRNSRAFKGLCMLLVLNIFAEVLSPMQALALTGGPAQPEFSSFTPIGTSDMVDLSSGDLNYNIPLMDVGGYPLNIAYSSGVGMDDEASWVGLGWNLSVGQINRNVRGLPDDFDGDEMIYENNLKPNVTVGASFKFTPAVFGVSHSATNDTMSDVTFGMTATYNNYTGFTMKPSVGVQFSLGKAASVGFNAESGPDGMTLSPNVSAHKKSADKQGYQRKMGLNLGASMNSRQGLTTASLSMNSSSSKKAEGTIKKINKSGSVGSSIGFTNMVYTPFKRNAMVTGSFTVNAALGTEVFGGEGQGQITAFGTVQKLEKSEKKKTMKAYGYANTDKGDSRAILDFNREKDGSVTSTSKNLPITNYTYDIYAVQGQGVSGMYRAYRNQVGFVYDAEVTDGSFSGSLGLEFGVGNAAHAGIDIEATNIFSRSGDWIESNNARGKFKESTTNPIAYEKVHYKNVGDLSTDRDFSDFYSKLGGYQPIRIPFIGSKFYRYTEGKYNVKSDGNSINIDNAIKRTKRQLRNQSINNVSIDELRSGIGYGPLATNEAGYLLPTEAKSHHIGEVQIVRNDGARYIYGLPAYNLSKKETTFAVGRAGNCNTGIVSYTPDVENSVNNKSNDHYFERVTTPAYVHTHLLTSVLSTDYVDRTGDGPTADDLGSYTKFSYEKKNPQYKWRVPLEENGASYNEGLKSDPLDNQGNYVYGEKEIYYLSKIETKTHVAIFNYSVRNDGKGVKGENGGIDNAQNSYKLDNIKLYSVKEYNGPSSVAIKEVHFEYDYLLCSGVLNNLNGGKLTLKNIYFKYRNSQMGKYTGYKFNYANNFNYNVKGYDSWGNYKPNTGTCENTSAVTAPEYPFVDQSREVLGVDGLTEQDKRAAAWHLTSVNLPSGGTINVKYESDDYAYVQDKEAMRMFKVAGAGNLDNVSSFSSDLSDVLYDFGAVDKHKKYIYVEVPEKAANADQAVIARKYFQGLDDRLYFRFLMNMTKAGSTAVNSTALNAAKFDYVTGYAELDLSHASSKIFMVGTKYYLSIPIKQVKREGGVAGALKVNPIAKASWHFGRKYLSKYAYSAQENGDTDDIEEIVAKLVSPTVLNNLVEIFTGPNATLENSGIGRRFIKDKSWVRLRESTGRKIGGGSRVKTVEMSDNWAVMTGVSGQPEMNYGQQYKYTLTDGTSSGVASYEPVGNKENPFVQPVFSSIEHLLAPDEENFIEMPFGESFFPNPQVTYSRVEVSNLSAGTNSSSKRVKLLHKTGSVVTEFYTTKDYPTIIDQTIMQAEEDTRKVLDNILALNVRKHMTASQGYVIHLNDMNGKQKSQRVYAEGQQAFISGVDYNYENYNANPVLNASQFLDQNKGKLNNQVRVIYPDGSVKLEAIGVEYDVVNDFRENRSNTSTRGINGNLAAFVVGIFPGLVPIPLPDFSKSEDQFRSVSTTKVVNTFGILKETVAYDAGARVATRNLAWDALTGEVLATETVDEFNDQYFTFNYPAHWMYSGMGQASQNLGLAGTLSALGGGLYGIQGEGSVSAYVSAGDEVVYGASNTKAWIVQVQPNNFKLMDAQGSMISNAAGKFKIIRSGRRNLQSAGIMNVTLMRNPLTNVAGGYVSNLGTSFLMASSWEQWKIINAGAVDYSEDWKASCECDVVKATGLYNPYRVNEKGVWRTKSSRTYLTGRNKQAQSTPRQQGFLSTFSPFYKLNASQTWYKDMDKWTFVSEVTRYSPYGFELENMDALNRYSAAQYGYNNSFPIAVGANSKYAELGFSGFEDYGFDGCKVNAHFRFPAELESSQTAGNAVLVTDKKSHTGKYSMVVKPGQRATLLKKTNCVTP